MQLKVQFDSQRLSRIRQTVPSHSPPPSAILIHENLHRGRGERAAERELRSLAPDLLILFYTVLKIINIISLLGSGLERILLNFHALFAPLKLEREIPF